MTSDLASALVMKFFRSDNFRRNWHTQTRLVWPLISLPPPFSLLRWCALPRRNMLTPLRSRSNNLHLARPSTSNVVNHLARYHLQFHIHRLISTPVMEICTSPGTLEITHRKGKCFLQWNSHYEVDLVLVYYLLASRDGVLSRRITDSLPYYCYIQLILDKNTVGNYKIAVQGTTARLV